MHAVSLKQTAGRLDSREGFRFAPIFTDGVFFFVDYLEGFHFGHFGGERALRGGCICLCPRMVGILFFVCVCHPPPSSVTNFFFFFFFVFVGNWPQYKEGRVATRSGHADECFIPLSSFFVEHVELQWHCDFVRAG